MKGLRGEELACVRGARLVFERLAFAVAPGEALLIVGPNGAGKSTLLRLMAGLLRPAAGRLLWDGTDTGHDSEAHRERIGYVGHLDGLKPALTVDENLRFWARLEGLHDDAVAAALARLGIDRLAEMPARLLSAGQRRRVNLARVTMGSASVWLLDEPTVGLDKEAIAALEAAIAAHQAAGGLVVAASHVDMFNNGAQRLTMQPHAPELQDEVW